ncbi:MAG: prephenate dehydratase [Candidatus Azotimanducaceae bacterium]
MINKELGLEELRERIDSLDERLLQLLNERAQCAQDIAKVKQIESVEEEPVFYRPEREAKVLRHLVERNSGPLTGEKVSQIFRQIMSACLALEQPLKIAYLGPEGTFTHIASRKNFGDSVLGLPMATQDEVFREVESESCNYGVVPVENSTEGFVSHTLDNFLESKLKICGEVELRVNHNLMVTERYCDLGIEKIYAHQQTLGQCRRWLDSNFPEVPKIAVTSNGEAARRIVDEKGAAAIAPDVCADIYNLQILSSSIEDFTDNTTRFIIIGRENVGASGTDKTSIMVSTKNEPGALYKLLGPFHRNGVSLTSIETRPSRVGVWSYVFFIDFEGHRDDPAVIEVLNDIDKDALEVKILGSYPKALTT